MIISSIKSEYLRYKNLAERAIEQTPEKELYKLFGEDNNSISVIVSHISGNLKSRFTDFLTSDGEKEWRKRDTEFEEKHLSKEELINIWNEGWSVLLNSLAELNDDDLNKTVTIREKELTAAEALHRSLAHTSYHVGQIVLIARMIVGKDWKSLSIPKRK
ncbi:dinB superfamily protein [bacterium BMS3Abin03]|nr:dinB superfamily protein [bacterium BMS3Abin03]